jgi:energy-converting hydrogenase A subunit C
VYNGDSHRLRGCPVRLVLRFRFYCGDGHRNPYDPGDIVRLFQPAYFPSLEHPVPVYPGGQTMIATYVCGAIAVYAAVRVILERNTMRKLPFLNVVSFGIAGIIALILPHPITIAAAAAYFIGSTLESNAIASTWSGGMK